MSMSEEIKKAIKEGKPTTPIILKYIKVGTKK